MNGGEDVPDDSELADSPAFTPVEELASERELLGVYVSGHPLQSCRKIISEVSTFKCSQLSATEAVDELMKTLPVAKWRKKQNPHLKDERGLKQLDVRVVASLSACSVKTPKPRADGTVGGKWAILSLDDGTGTMDAFCFAKAWGKFNVENCVNKLVVVCGEVSHRINYDKDDKIEKKRPSVGDLNFTVKEAYPVEDAMNILSKALRVRVHHSDPSMSEKVNEIAATASRHPGMLPVVVEVAYDDGTVVDVDLGPSKRVSCTMALLSELAKIVPQSDTSFRPSSDIYLAPPEPKPWESE
jgi:DNA polymerase III alpha subunit